jgi:hypothetical protein
MSGEFPGLVGFLGQRLFADFSRIDRADLQKAETPDGGGCSLP